MTMHTTMTTLTLTSLIPPILTTLVNPNKKTHTPIM
uniref:Truncated NADH dehydrogenase subunit 5 n=1 Tax=Homo sapiens TaxID=9606 RepID=A0A096W714_HUMAN|nr:truncated NADH dehydrogenase subunit 5 [Homo sapiens]AIL91081.1 truncated NADH dehydrogenase subunit 5 [Homo sapiens]